MRLLFASPAGLWALLAIPVIVLIHFLQERSRRVRVSTLFLLERVKPESVAGARMERLRNSVPLWLQLAAALLITWMLVEPRWIRADSRQTVAVVLDSSVSMSAFREQTRELLETRLRQWSRTAAHTQWHLLESDPRKPTLYAGEDLKGVLDAVASWQPTRGTHRPDDVLLVARGLVKSSGIVIFVTDRKIEVPSDVALLSAGEPVENTGFAGAEVSLAAGTEPSTSATLWKVLVRNYGAKPARREWWVEFPDAKGGTARTSQKQPVEIAPGQSVSLGGELPPDVERAVVVLEEDRFAWDDRFPIQKPQPRVVRAEIRVGGRSGDLWRKMLGALAHVEVAGPGASAPPAGGGQAPRSPDFAVAELGTVIDVPGIQFPVSEDEDIQLDPAWTVAENHPLVRDVNWMGLMTPRPAELSVTENDEPLLWKGDRPLAMVRRTRAEQGPALRRLLLAWDPTHSNAARNPAMLILVHRFVEDVRQQMTGAWAGNFEAGQVLSSGASAPDGSAPPVVITHDGAKSKYDGRLPDTVGFFDLKQEDKLLLSGAASFADTREADFHEAAALDTVEQRRWEAALKQTEADPFAPLWVLLTLGCLVTAWGWRQARRPRVPPTPPAPATAS